MTRPFQYDNFVQSQIAMGNGNSQTYIGSGVRKNQTNNGNQSRLSLKQKINELLGLCQQQNQGMKTQFKQVIGAQKQILQMMKQQLDQPPKFNNYARSDVQMFQGPNQMQSVMTVPFNQINYHGYEQDVRPRGNQSFPQTRSPYNTAPLQGRNYNQLGFQEDENYGNDYTPTNHQINQRNRIQGTIPFDQGPYPQQNLYSQQNQYSKQNQYPQQGDRSQFLKSKVQQLRQQNNRLRGFNNQPQIYQQGPHILQQTQQINHQGDDRQIQILKQQVARLRRIAQDYQNQIAQLNDNPQAADREYLLKQLKQQGERIRQDTIALLKNKASQGQYVNSGYAQNVNPGIYKKSGFGPSVNRQINYGVQKKLTPEQQALFRNQLNQLRNQCQQLQQQNANIKRLSKGTNYTSGSRRN